jgi:hypothetical protein
MISGSPQVFTEAREPLLTERNAWLFIYFEHYLKVALVPPAVWADPIIGQVIKRHLRSYRALEIAFVRVINIPTSQAFEFA